MARPTVRPGDRLPILEPPRLDGKDAETPILSALIRWCGRVSDALNRLSVSAEAVRDPVSRMLGTPGVPRTVLVGDPATQATAGVGPVVMNDDAQLVVERGTALGLANANADGSTGKASDAGHQHKRDVRVQNSGGDVGTRNALRLLAGAAITRGVVDNSGSDRVEDTVAVTNPPTTKGDLWGYGATVNRVPVGSNYTLLEADTAQTLGLAWTALVTILGRFLTTPGLIAHDGVTPVVRGIGAAQNGNAIWVDTRGATRLATGDAPNMPGSPWLGHWIRDSALTNNVAFEVLRVAMPADVDEWSGHIEYTAVGSDGTDLNKEVGALNVSAIRDSTSTVDAVVGTVYGALQHVPVGTITVTWSASVVGADAIFSCTINSSLAADVWLEFRLKADNNAQTVTFAQT
jgi:hypothetical protein